MTNKVIQVSGLSKQYRLGQVGTGSLSNDINRVWHKARGKEDPYLKVGEENNRETKGNSDYVWALKDINFEIEQGDRVGIIGRNGAGKSTLLKILSRTTSPTSGSVKIKGKVASLLEVGTGFHPDLSGRDNIFLNGAILGMSKRDIKTRFDEIVDFAGVERYIDTPVKRYSSGMYVRLAFAVAANLESDIVIVDEVLAVGDADFQKKCLGKMGDLSDKQGRTIIFVSHNMDAVMRLCSHAIMLENGCIQGYDNTEAIITQYFKSNYETSALKKWEEIDAPGNDKVKLLKISAYDSTGTIKDVFDITEQFFIKLNYRILKSDNKIIPAIKFFNVNGINIFDSHQIVNESVLINQLEGNFEATICVPANLLNDGTIIIGVAFLTHEPFTIHIHETGVIAFNMTDKNRNNPTRGIYKGSIPGNIRPLLKWTSVTL